MADELTTQFAYSLESAELMIGMAVSENVVVSTGFRHVSFDDAFMTNADTIENLAIAIAGNDLTDGRLRATFG